MVLPDDEYLADQRVTPQAVLQRGRGDVLPTGGDNELLLAPRDPQEALGAFEGADVPGSQPAVVGEGLGRGLGVVVVSREGADALDQDLPVVGQAERAAGQWGADSPDPGGLGQVDAARTHGLGQAVALQDGDSGAAVEVSQALAQRPTSGDDVRDPPSQHGAQGGEDELVEGGALSLEAARRALRGVQGPGVRDRGLGRQAEDLLLGAGRLGIGGVIDLLEDPGDGQYRGGPEGAQVVEEITDVRHVPQYARARADDRDLHEPAEYVGQGQEQ